MDVFPEAKVILSVRNPETWYESVKNTIFQFYKPDFAVSLFMKLTFPNSDDFEHVITHVPEGMDKGKDFNGQTHAWPASSFHFELEQFSGMMVAIAEGKDSSVEYFNKWTQQVKKVVPKDKLLLFEAKEGWEPLCQFLDVPVPDGEYPR